VFHFLTDDLDRARYVQAVRDSVRPGGHVIVAAFGPDGPLKCSNSSTATAECLDLGVFDRRAIFLNLTSRN
jgi:hypothetical protein